MLKAISDLFARINLGEPVTAHGLRVFPVFPLDADPVKFLLLADSLAQGLAEIREADTGHGPWFRELLIETWADRPVLLRESDLLVGGRQDRVADRTCLLPAHGRTVIPVSCVEAGRSHYADAEHFVAGVAGADLGIRHERLRQTATTHDRPDQDQTWKLVAERRQRASFVDGSGSLHQAQIAPDPAIEETVAALPAVLGTSGLVLARVTDSGPRAVAVELFSNRDACRVAWPSLVRAAAQTVTQRKADPRISRTEVRKLFADIAQVEGRSVPALGLGTLTLFTSGKIAGSALVLNGIAAHIALVRG